MGVPSLLRTGHDALAEFGLLAKVHERLEKMSVGERKVGAQRREFGARLGVELNAVSGLGDRAVLAQEDVELLQREVSVVGAVDHAFS